MTENVSLYMLSEDAISFSNIFYLWLVESIDTENPQVGKMKG
jgi:hypothetical protein